VDAHLHLLDPAALPYFWLEPSNALHRAFLPEDFEAIRHANGIGRAVFVQASHSPLETPWALALAARTPWLAGVVGWVNLEAPDVETQLEVWRVDPTFKGVRHLAHTEADPRWWLRPAVQRGVAVLERHGLSLDIVVRPERLRVVAELAARFPALTVVLDHLGNPGDDLKTWRADLERLGALPNVSAKLSGLAHLSDKPLETVVGAALEVFGETRLLYGGDWPVSAQQRTYGDELTRLRGCLEGCGVRGAGVWCDNAVRVYALVDTDSTAVPNRVP
jgi:L-fuconolactonase